MKKAIILSILFLGLSAIGIAQDSRTIKQNHIKIINVQRDKYLNRYKSPDTISDIYYSNENKLIASTIRDPSNPLYQLFHDIHEYASNLWSRIGSDSNSESLNSDWTNDTIYIVETRKYPTGSLPRMFPSVLIVNSCDTVYKQSFIPYGTDYASPFSYIPVDTMPDLEEIDIRLALDSDISKLYKNISVGCIPAPKKTNLNLAITSDFSELFSALQKSIPPRNDKLFDVITQIIIKDGYLDITRIIIDGRLHTLSTE